MSITSTKMEEEDVVVMKAVTDMEKRARKEKEWNGERELCGRRWIQERWIGVCMDGMSGASTKMEKVQEESVTAIETPAEQEDDRKADRERLQHRRSRA